MPVVVSGRIQSPSAPNLKTFTSGMFSLEGRKQEDRIICGERVFRDIYLYAVIDGHGGSDTAVYLQEALPRVVSSLCRERFALLKSLRESPDLFQDILKLAFKVCAEEWDRGVNTVSRRLAGAVITAVLVEDRTCLIAHVGDGRVVAATANAFAELTEEHRAKNPAEKERIESKGGRVVSGRVRGLLAPSRAFGDVHVRTTEEGDLLDCITPDPDVSLFEVDLQGFLVLSTDGVNDVVGPGETADFVRSSLKKSCDPSNAARELAIHAQQRTDDDISVVVLAWA